MKNFILLTLMLLGNLMAQEHILFSTWHDNNIIKLNVLTGDKVVYALDSVETVRDPFLISDSLLVTNSFFKGKSKCALYDIRTGKVLKILDWLYSFVYDDIIVKDHDSYDSSFEYFNVNKMEYGSIDFQPKRRQLGNTHKNGRFIYFLKDNDLTKLTSLWKIKLDDENMRKIYTFDREFRYIFSDDYSGNENYYYFYNYKNTIPTTFIFDISLNKILKVIKGAKPLSWYKKYEIFILRNKSDLYLYNIKDDTEKLLFSKEGLWDIKFVEGKYIIGYYFWKIDHFMNFAGFVKYDFKTKEIKTIYTFEKFKFNTATEWQLF